MDSCAVESLCLLMQVSQDLPFLHPSESSVLNRLCKMGTDYVRFTEFIEQHTGHVHQQVCTMFLWDEQSPFLVLMLTSAIFPLLDSDLLL